AIHVRQLIEARVYEVHSDIPSIIETLLLGLFSTVAAVVQDDTDEGDTPAYCSIQFLGRVQKSPVSLQAHSRALGAPQFGPETNAQPHAKPSVAGVIEHGPRYLEVQAIVGQTGGYTSIDSHHTVARQGPAQLGIDSLWHHWFAAEGGLCLQPVPTPR